MRFEILDLNPEPWTSPQVSIGRKGGKAFPRFYSNEQMKNFKEALAEAVRQKLPEDFEPFEIPIGVTFYFWRRLDEYQSPQARTARKHEADATNLQKAAEDALQGVLFKNDKDVSVVTSYIMEQAHDTRPAVVVEIEQYPKKPVVLLKDERQQELPLDDRDPYADKREALAEEYF